MCAHPYATPRPLASLMVVGKSGIVPMRALETKSPWRLISNPLVKGKVWLAGAGGAPAGIGRAHALRVPGAVRAGAAWRGRGDSDAPDADAGDIPNACR